MSLRAFERVPFLEEEAYQWWESFDMTGTPVLHPNPSSTLIKLIAMLDRLTTEEIGWKPEDIHLFGFAQGASCLSELALLWTRSRPTAAPLASIVSVSGPLLSLPTIPTSRRSPTPVLLWTRRGEDDPGKWRAGFERGFQSVQPFLAPRASQEQMPMTPQEWKPILELGCFQNLFVRLWSMDFDQSLIFFLCRFWSKLLKSRHPWELNDRNTEDSSTYEVRAG
jgi:hypothetical protein